MYRNDLSRAKRNRTTRCFPLRIVTGTVLAWACRCRNDSHRPGASPRRAQSVGAVIPCLPIGSVRAHWAAGMRAKKSSIVFRYCATATTTGVNCSTKLCINRALARTTWAGTGNWGCWRTFQRSPMRASLNRRPRAHRCHWRVVSAVRASGVGQACRNSRANAVVNSGDLERPRVVRLQRGRQLIDQAGLLADVPLAVLREEFELLGRVRARLQGLEVGVIRAQEVGQHPRVKRITLRPTLSKPIPGPVQRLGIHGIDYDAMIEQEVHHPTVRPLDRRPPLDPLRVPLVQLPAPLAEARRRMRHGARGDLRPALIDDPDRMRLIRPIDSHVVAHSSPSFWSLHSEPRSGNGQVGLIPALRGATFS